VLIHELIAQKAALGKTAGALAKIMAVAAPSTRSPCSLHHHILTIKKKKFKQTLRIKGQQGDIIHLTENKCLFL